MAENVDEKPFACRVCQKSFSQKCDLSRHEAVHSGQKITSSVSQKTLIINRNSPLCVLNDKRTHFHQTEFNGKKIFEKHTCLTHNKKPYDQICNVNNFDYCLTSERSKNKTTLKTFVSELFNQIISDNSEFDKPIQVNTDDKPYAFNECTEISLNQKTNSKDKFVSDVCNKRPLENPSINYHQIYSVNQFNQKVPNKCALDIQPHAHHQIGHQSIPFHNKAVEKIEETKKNFPFSCHQQQTLNDFNQETSKNFDLNKQLYSKAEMSYLSVPAYQKSFKNIKETVKSAPICSQAPETFNLFNQDVPENFALNNQVCVPVQIDTISDTSSNKMSKKYTLNTQTLSSHVPYLSDRPNQEIFREISPNEHLQTYNKEEPNAYNLCNSEMSENVSSNQHFSITDCNPNVSFISNSTIQENNVYHHQHLQAVNKGEPNFSPIHYSGISQNVPNQYCGVAFNKDQNVSNNVSNPEVSKKFLTNQYFQTYNKEQMFENFLPNQHLQTFCKEPNFSHTSNPDISGNTSYSQHSQTYIEESNVSHISDPGIFLLSKPFQSHNIELNVSHTPNLEIACNIPSYQFW